MVDRHMGRDPASQRFPRDVRLVASERCHHLQDVVRIGRNLIVDFGPVAPAMPHQIHGDGPEMFTMRLHVAHIGLGMTARAVDEQQQRRSEEHTSELQSLMRISYAVFCLKKKTKQTNSSNKTFAARPVRTYDTKT